MNLNVVLFLSFIFTINGAELPSYIRKCKYTEIDACGAEAANEALPMFLQGDAIFGTPSYLPLKIGRVNFDVDNFKMNFDNVEMHGFDTMKVTYINFGTARLEFNCGLHFDEISLMGEYQPNATIYDITLPERGYATFNLEDVSYSMGISIRLGKKIRNKTEYFLSKPSATLKTKALAINFYESGTHKLLYSIKNSKVLSKPVLNVIESQIYEAVWNVGKVIPEKFKFEELFEGPL